MSGKNTKTWFPAKTQGWGWGMPHSWQGWLVLLTYMITVVVVSIMRDAGALSTSIWLFAVLTLTALLIAVFYLKGEKPKWRWGEDED